LQENEINFSEYYDRIIKELKKNEERDEKYFDTLDMLLGTILLNNDLTELDKVACLRNIVYSNGSLDEETLTNIDKELGYEKYYEESCE
jgi:hypothetical protein